MIQMVLAAEGLDDVRAAIAHGARLISPYDTMSLYETQGSSALEVSFRRGDQLGPSADAVEELLCAKTGKTGRTASTLDRFVTDEEQTLVDEYMRGHGLCLARALQAYGTFIGLVIFHYPTRAALAEVEFDALRRFVESAAVALSNARTRNELRSFAYTDPLTGLANRRRLESEFALLDGTQLSLLLIDFDGLKVVNDTLGYDRGDALIATVGLTLSTSAYRGELVVRLGGDEFVVIMPKASRSAAQLRAEEMTGTLDRLALPKDLERLFHGASVGSATAEPGEDPWEVLRRASSEMRSRKRRRKTDRELTSEQAPERRFDRRSDA